jgi:Helix-turn-helix domain
MSSPLSREETVRIREMLDSGKSHNAIAKQVGRAQSTISEFAKRAGIAPVNRTPVSAIERRKDFALEARLEATGDLMAKVLEIAAHAKSGREIKEVCVAWGVLCDKRAIMERLPSSRTETYGGHAHHGKTIDLEKEFAKLDEDMLAEARRDEELLQEQHRQALGEE